MGASGLVVAHLEEQSIWKTDLQFGFSSDSIWSGGDDVVASGCVAH